MNFKEALNIGTISKMQIKDFKNIHTGEDIYNICSGKSIDYISNDFFDNKIKLGINKTYKKVSCKYYVRKEAELLEDILEKEEHDNRTYKRKTR